MEAQQDPYAYSSSWSQQQQQYPQPLVQQAQQLPSQLQPQQQFYGGGAQPMPPVAASVPGDQNEQELFNNHQQPQEAMGATTVQNHGPSDSPPVTSKETDPLNKQVGENGERDWKYWTRRVILGKEDGDLESYHPWLTQLKKEVRRILAEYFGTLFLIFFICGSQLIDVFSTAESEVSVLTKGIVSGFALCALIYTFGQISGCHVNPIITVAFALRGLFKWWRVPFYIVAQFLGALTAVGILVGIFDNIGGLGATMPGAPPVTIRQVTKGQALGMEIVLSFLLVTVVLTAVERTKIMGLMSAIAIGTAFVAIEVIGWNISGASVNPWRSFAPTIISGEGWHTIWIYFAGPIAGMLLAVVGQRIFVGRRRRKEAKQSARGCGMTSGCVV